MRSSGARSVTSRTTRRAWRDSGASRRDQRVVVQLHRVQVDEQQRRRSASRRACARPDRGRSRPSSCSRPSRSAASNRSGGERSVGSSLRTSASYANAARRDHDTIGWYAIQSVCIALREPRLEPGPIAEVLPLEAEHLQRLALDLRHLVQAHRARDDLLQLRGIDRLDEIAERAVLHRPHRAVDRRARRS